MSDNEDGLIVSENEASGSESEASIHEEDLIEDNKDYNSVSESDSDDEKKPKKKVIEAKNKPKTKPKKSDEHDEDDVEEIDAEDEEEEEFELDARLVEKAESLSQKFGIVVDPRHIDNIAKPGPKIKREIVVSYDKYKSSEYMTEFEFCDLVGVRAEHISKGADTTILTETTAREIAKKELQMGLCPFLIKRYMTPMNFDPVYVEIWCPNEMAINAKFFST